MAERNELVLADFFLGRAETKPDFQILTFEGAGVRDDETRTYQQIWLNSQAIASAMIERDLRHLRENPR